MREYGIGQSLPRSEDFRLLRGLGRYTDDIRLHGEARLYVLRSPHAAARIRAIDTAAAAAAPGVLAVLTGKDALADNLGTFPSRMKMKRKDGRPNYEPPYRLLAADRVALVGDPVVAVVAETLAQAKDAAELVEIDYEPQASVTATTAAAQPGAPSVWDEQPDNICFVAEFGKKDTVEAGFTKAAHVAKLDFVVNRVSANSMEPRAGLGVYDAADDRYTLYASLQSPHQMRTHLAENIFKLPEGKFRVVAPDVGGAFGMKGAPMPELGLVLWASKKVGRPVKWMSERGEALMSDHHARDNAGHVELALDKDGKFLALRISNTVNLGAYLSFNGIHCGVNNVGGLSGVYTTPAIHLTVTGVFTNTNPTAPYRGAGRPEASYMVERIIDTAAREMNIDPAELRRRNLIPASAMPYNTGFVFTYDSGEFEHNQEAVLKLADWSGFEKRRAEAKSRARLRGIGMAHVIEIAGGPAGIPFDEYAEVRFDPAGGCTLILGTHNHGQGHETTFRQLAHEFLGLDPSQVQVRFGDSDAVAHGRGTFGSRSISVGGAALLRASEKIIAKGRKIAAHLMEAAEADIEFKDGKFAVGGTDKAVDLIKVAKTAFMPAQIPRGMEPGLIEGAALVPPGATFPNGCHICEVEIDPDTGVTEIVGYWVVDDVGIMVNPQIVKGQIHGGIVQGAGQILLENVAYDPDNGQMLSGSFMDYGMPRASDFPEFVIKSHEVPAKTNPLGIKGAGEAGTVGALPATMNAIVDALRPLGIRTLDMPATPQRIWKTIAAAKVAG
jgi:aerobic carbon-monoxide dehydrogenase large subunit